MRVSLRNGQHMVGVDLPYLPENLPRYDVALGATIAPIPARTGDMPAIVLPSLSDGLAIFVVQTSDLTVPYKEFAGFEKFAHHKDEADAIALHKARGLPEAGFIESFKRYAKSLVAIGSGVGADRPMGLRIEIVAQENPYLDDMTDGMTLLVLLDGQPRKTAQLSLFETTSAGVVSETFYKTDDQGLVTVPAQPGATYLADSVDLFALPNNDAAAGPVWHSDWASLTYAVP